MIRQALARWKYKSVRIRHHLRALLKYPSARKILNILCVEFEYRLKRERVLGRPYVALIDPSSICNLRCPTCPTTQKTLPVGSMVLSLENFKAAFDKISANLIVLNLYNWGEPFLNKDIIGIIKHARTKKVFTAISSNMNAMPLGGAEAIVKSGLDKIIVSCDGLTQETYEKYRRGGKIEKVLTNLHAIVDEKKRQGTKFPIVEFQYLIFKHNQHELPEIESFALKNGADIIRIVSPMLSANEFGLENSTVPGFGPPPIHRTHSKATNRAISCYWPWRGIVINSEGTVDPCCIHSGKAHFGDLIKGDFRKLWNGVEYRQARRRIAGKRVDASTEIVCLQCKGLR